MRCHLKGSIYTWTSLNTFLLLAMECVRSNKCFTSVGFEMG